VGGAGVVGVGITGAAGGVLAGGAGVLDVGGSTVGSCWVCVRPGAVSVAVVGVVAIVGVVVVAVLLDASVVVVGLGLSGPTRLACSSGR
jgi:hypothetical protein